MIGSFDAGVDNKEMEVFSFLEAAAGFEPQDIFLQGDLAADPPELVERGGVDSRPVQGRDDADFSGSG